jgi:SsrA-binding protein
VTAPAKTLPVIENRKARHDYHILETYETGIVLKGTEIKSIRMGKMSLAEAFADVRHGELFLINAHIDEYLQANRFNHAPLRERKLLANRKEIDEMEQATSRTGLTLVPLKAYFKDGRLKVLIGTAKGKMAHDKRADKAKQEAKVEIARALRNANR